MEDLTTKTYAELKKIANKLGINPLQKAVVLIKEIESKDLPKDVTNNIINPKPVEIVQGDFEKFRDLIKVAILDKITKRVDINQLYSDFLLEDEEVKGDVNKTINFALKKIL